MPHRSPTDLSSYEAPAAQAAYLGFLRDFRRAHVAGLVGALMVAWVAQHFIGATRSLSWLALSGAALGLEALVHRWLHREAQAGRRHERVLGLAMALDGAGWGALAWVALGVHPTFDRWVGIVLCGVAAFNALTTVRQPRAYQVQVLAISLVGLSGIWFNSPDDALQRVVALGVFFALLVLLQRPLAKELHQGLLSQQAHADLAGRLAVALESAEQAARVDALTGLPNRRAFDAQLERLVSGAARQGFSLLVLDIDHFKAVNDRHGHAVGDACLRAFGDRVQQVLRPSDFAARTGGEEFVVLLPGTALAQAVEVAERLRLAVQDEPLLRDPMLAITVSIGVAEYRAAETADTVLDRADAAAYGAKRAGRNRVETAPPTPALG